MKKCIVPLWDEVLFAADEFTKKLEVDGLWSVFERMCHVQNKKSYLKYCKHGGLQ